VMTLGSLFATAAYGTSPGSENEEWRLPIIVRNEQLIRVLV
jgi:hypothetical protein